MAGLFFLPIGVNKGKFSVYNSLTRFQYRVEPAP